MILRGPLSSLEDAAEGSCERPDEFHSIAKSSLAARLLRRTVGQGVEEEQERESAAVWVPFFLVDLAQLTAHALDQRSRRRAHFCVREPLSLNAEIGPPRWGIELGG